LYFGDLYKRLLEIARERVRSGQISERRLARASELSQPHLHNVLKDIRTLSPGSADRLMRALEIAIPDLLWQPGENTGGVGAVPVLRARVGPGSGAETGPPVGFSPVPVSLLRGLVDPVLARLAPDLLLPRLLAPNDLVLLDQNPERRAHPAGNGCWMVWEEGGLRARYVKVRGTEVFLANEETLKDPRRWRPVSAAAGNILDTVRARIVWISREMETDPARPAGPVGERD
jgi:hypothetical protein